MFLKRNFIGKNGIVKKYFSRKSPASILILGIVIGLAMIAFVVIIAGVGLMAELTGSNSGAEQASSRVGELTYPIGIDPITAGECLDSYIKSVVPSSPLAGYGATFVQAGKQHNINPALLIAIGKQESALGTKGIVLNHPYNYYGMTKTGGGWASYDSWEEAINNHARYLRESYLSQGLGTIAQIGAKYAPTQGATNDPTGLNSNWAKGVTSAFQAIIIKCPSLSVGGGGDVVSIAQSQLGVKEAYDNCDCGEVEKYGGRGVPWCAYFVSWVYKQAGYNMPSIGGAQALYDWFGKNQISFPRGSGTPQPGDIVYFSYSHIGIVEYYENDIVHTIEGNTGSRSVKRETHSINSATIVGFGRWKK